LDAVPRAGDGDGDVDATDQSLVTAALNQRIFNSSYNVDADFNRDGFVNSSDSHFVGLS